MNVSPNHIYSLVFLFILVANNTAIAEPQDEPIFTAPYVSLTRDDVRNVFEEARVQQSLQANKPLSLSDLVGYPQRYRVLLEQLEHRAIAQVVAERPTKADYQNILHGLTKGVRLSKILSQSHVKYLSQGDESSLAKRYRTNPALIRRIVLQQWKKHQFADQLFDKLPEAYMLSNWFERELKLRFTAVTIPRVPTSAEIDQAVQQQSRAIKSRYARERRRFVKPAKIIATRVLVPWRSPRTPSLDEWVRRKAKTLRKQARNGVDGDELVRKAGYGPDQRKQGRVTLLSQKHRELAAKNIGALSKIEENDVGVFFHQVVTHIPRFERSLNEPTVQRELAAEILRENNELPTAYQQAMKAVGLLKSASRPITLTMLNAQGAKLMQPEPFAPFANQLIPGIGTSSSASSQLQAAPQGHVITPPIAIRQDYVVFRADEWVLPELADWWQEAPSVWPLFVRKAKRQLIDSWLAKRLPKDKIKVDAKVLSELDLAPIKSP